MLMDEIIKHNVYVSEVISSYGEQAFDREGNQKMKDTP